jgi:hypothetical protein
MPRTRQIIKLTALFIAIGIAAAAVIVAIVFRYEKPIVLRGAVMKQDSDPAAQSPITDAEITVTRQDQSIVAKSDFSGYFRLDLPRNIRRGEPIVLRVQRADYAPIDLREVVSDKLYIIHMASLHPDVQPKGPSIAITNVFVRYTTETVATVNIGTGVKTFQVKNKGDVPCQASPPCSPDGRWKAAISAVSLDAGTDNVYEDARLSCIAGPCPFTRVVSDRSEDNGRKIAFSVLNWSDTTTFLLQAEVFRQEISSSVQESYPVKFGQAMNFTLPPSAEGPSIEAELNGTDIVFPLGPIPILSWADCNVRVGKDQSKSYRCELKPGYRFQ